MITPPQENLEGLPVSDPSGSPGSSLNSLFTGCSLRFLFPEVSALFFFSLLSAISVGRVTTERRIRRPTRQLLAARSRAREISLASQAMPGQETTVPRTLYGEPDTSAYTPGNYAENAVFTWCSAASKKLPLGAGLLYRVTPLVVLLKERLSMLVSLII